MGTARNVLAVLTFLVPAAIGQPPMSKAMKEPALPYVDEDACPFEGCAYRAWKTLKPVEVYDTWKEGRQTVAHLAPGDAVTGLTGVVVTFRPGVARLDRDLPAQNLKRGDFVLTYTYRGEGFFAVWFNGRFYPMFDFAAVAAPTAVTPCPPSQCAGTMVDLGRQQWWAKIKLKTDLIGWVMMDASEFSGVDSLG